MYLRKSMYFSRVFSGKKMLPLILILGLFVPTFTMSAHSAETITLKVGEHFAITHYISKNGIQFWMKRVTELTNGRVQFKHFPGEQLGKTSDMLDLVSNGVADVGYLPMPYFAGRMPLITGAAAYSGSWSDSLDGNPAIMEMTTTSPVLENDFLKNGIRPILPFANANFQLWTTKKEVKKPADIKGLKIRSGGGEQDNILASYPGAIPVMIAAPEIYEALSRGTVDGVLLSAASGHAYRIEEVCKYGLWGFNISGGILGYVINEKVYQKMPDDVKKAMGQASKDASENLARETVKEDLKWKQEFIKKGIKITDLTPAEQKEWAAFQDPVKEAWYKAMAAKGLDGRSVLERLFKLSAQNRKN